MKVNAEIYNYSNYRAFLKDYYAAKKAESKRFTFGLFAAVTGFASPSFLKLVMDGRKNLTKPSVLKISRGLRMKKNQAQYFEDLVFFNQASALEDKTHYLERLNDYRRKNRPEKLLPGEYDYLSRWYHCVVREMVDLAGFREDPKWIAGKLLHAIKPKEISRSLSFLEEKRFIGRNGSGKLVKKNKTIATGNIGEQEILNTIARSFHLNMIRLAETSVSTQPKAVRNTSNTTLSLSAAGYDTAVKRIEQLRMELLEIAQSDENADRIYQLNINLFPFTEVTSDG